MRNDVVSELADDLALPVKLLSRLGAKHLASVQLGLEVGDHGLDAEGVLLKASLSLSVGNVVHLMVSTILAVVFSDNLPVVEGDGQDEGLEGLVGSLAEVASHEGGYGRHHVGVEHLRRNRIGVGLGVALRNSDAMVAVALGLERTLVRILTK